MDEFTSAGSENDKCGEKPRKKLKSNFNFVDNLNYVYYKIDNVKKNNLEGCGPSDVKNIENRLQNVEFAINIPLEDDEKLLTDSGIDLDDSTCKEHFEDDKVFEIRRVRRYSRLNEEEGTSQNKEISLKSLLDESDSNVIRNSQFRGETPEVNDTEKHNKATDTKLLELVVLEEQVKNNNINYSEMPQDNINSLKRTPDRSLFKNIHEKLLYECNLTPKKVKKKCLKLYMES